LLGSTESVLGLEEQRRLEGTQRGERNAGETLIDQQQVEQDSLNTWETGCIVRGCLRTSKRNVSLQERWSTGGKGVERQDERYWEEEGTKAMVKHAGESTGQDVETEKENGEPQRGSARPQQPVI